MAKGLADIETKRIISQATEEDTKEVPYPFWCGDSSVNIKSCCFWHYVFFPNQGPERDGFYHPVYEYENQILRALDKNKCLAVYKATGLGITELMLMWIIWKCHTDEFFFGKTCVVITGPNVKLSQDLIDRTKGLLRKGGLDYVDRGAYEVGINGCKIECFPSNNIASARGIPKVSCFFGDESAFFKLRDDSVVQTVGERYIGKSDSYVVWVSTAGEEPQGFFFDIMEEQESIYNRIHMYVEEGLKTDRNTGTSIFTKEFIEHAKLARSFDREYLGFWGKNVGDIFSQEALDGMFSEEYAIRANDDSYDRVLGIDPAFGSSEFGLVAMQKSGGKYTIIHAEGIERTSSISVLRHIDDICKRFRIRKIFCDASAPAIIKDLRDEYNYTVNGIAFNEYGEKMLHNAADKVARMEVKAHPNFKGLKNQLMTIKLNKKGLPDKNPRNTFDMGDAFLLAMWYYKMGSGTLIGVY